MPSNLTEERNLWEISKTKPCSVSGCGVKYDINKQESHPINDNVYHGPDSQFWSMCEICLKGFCGGGTNCDKKGCNAICQTQDGVCDDCEPFDTYGKYRAESFESEDSKEYLVEIRNTRGDVLWRSPCPDYEYLIKEINHMLKTHYYAIDVFTTEYGRKIHMATIKYGKAESGPLAAKLNESLIFRAESFESETMDWTDADLFVDWLKDENIIFHELTNRTHKGPNYGAFRKWNFYRGVWQPTRRLWEESNFHMFERT
ncbi:unnamed protein product, partial [marine sediment metagenome]